jgi:aspartyl-tRNA(Asn)/glutamyl-tRNA(Gln) amidotransferase subunit A
VTANLAGIPGLSLPCGFVQDMPVGLQILGAPLEEATVLRVADAWQRRSDFHLRRPPELA